MNARECANSFELHVRHHVTEIVELFDEQRFDLLGAKRRYGDWNILHCLSFASLSRNRHNLFQKGTGRAFLRERRIW